ncbi:carbohydrate ABC transporter permease [Frigoribacterium sp. VKM Ac-1396]|jgi:multiple sugar transport system permease protein|uniref:carbohydrate ABC transporter permease n=1 Tax=Frigoribacterium sp. VKM Ac-1396 TaxID=2783821 RepID=UPI00188C7468|nr:carbohydrate ABC transporter permease [Frigoribacterium sp. VKM Ac-1396]MBF4601140.1 carbohydrate ABC transporter permease [Frigoribacterium sp. VKM Ac-1396]
MTAPAIAPTSTLRAPTADRGRKGHKPGQKPFGPMAVVSVVILVVLAVLWLLPFLWSLATSFKSEADAAASPQTWIPAGGFTLDAYRGVLEQGNIPVWLFNSLFTSVVITLIVVATSALVAYAFSRLDFRGKKWLYVATIASIIIPPQVLIVPLFYQMLAFDMVDTYWGIILPQAIAPAMVFVLKKFFDQVPIELEDAARVDGAGRIRVFFTILLPLSRPILGAVSIFVFIGAWNNFLWPFIVTNDASLLTLPVGLQTIESAYGIQYAQNMAAAILAALPLILVFLFFQRQIIKGISTTGFGGQ